MSAISTSRPRDLIQILFFAIVVRPFMTIFIGLRVRGREHLGQTDPFILVANHSSHLDTVSLLNLFPLGRLRHVRPCAASDYFERNPVVSWFSHTFFNILPIARINVRRETHPVLLMKEALARGESLLFFPEGTRGTANELGPLRPGIARLIEEVPGLAVVPAYLENMGRALPKGEFVPVPFFCEVRLGAPRTFSGTREQILADLRAAIVALRDDA